MKNIFIATTLAEKSSILHPPRLGAFVFLSLGVSPDIPTASLGVPFCRQLGVFVIPDISISGFNWQSEIKKESKPYFVFLFTTLDFAVSSLILSSTTSMVIFVAPVDDKCLKIDLASGLALFSRIIEIESRISFSNTSLISKYYYQINITRPSTTFRDNTKFRLLSPQITETVAQSCSVKRCS